MSEDGKNYLKQFGKAVRIRRLELGLSQEKLAHKANLHRTYIGDVERGERNIALINIKKLAEALEIPVSTLFTKYVEGEQEK